MDWFERITGFPEDDYASTKARLEVDGQFLISKVNGNRHRVGQLEVVTLQNLRARRARSKTKGCNTSVHCLAGDARELHARPEFAGATFQVASQFNLLEMVGPSITPEDGVTRYIGDRTQGPACAIAAGAGTIYRNYFAPVGGGLGQTRHRRWRLWARRSPHVWAGLCNRCGPCATAMRCARWTVSRRSAATCNGPTNRSWITCAGCWRSACTAMWR